MSEEVTKRSTTEATRKVGRRRKHSFFTNIAEVRTIEYIVRELGTGRELFVILEDPYVRNRIAPERRGALQEDEELLEAFLAEIEAVRDKMGASINENIAHAATDADKGVE